MKVQRAMRSGVRRAFSLLEVMLVLTIIAIMTAAVAYNLIGAGERAKIKATKGFMGTIQQGLSEYKLTNNALPATLETLQQGQHPILEKSKAIVDAWDRPFVYSANPSNGQDYQLYSRGPDGLFPSSDDIDLWKIKTSGN